MICPNCGAEITEGKFCQFCGRQITAEMRKEQEQINKEGCPRCGSSSISFSREYQGEIRGKAGTTVVRATVGVCKDCGFTWHPQGASQTPKKRKTWLWVLGWIFIFPVPLTILMLRRKEMKPTLKYGIIAAAWIVYLIIAFTGNSDSAETTKTRGAGSDSGSNITAITFLREENVTVSVGEKTRPSYVTVKVKRRSDFSPEDVLFISDDPEVATIHFTNEASTTYLYYEISGVSPGETTVYVSSKDGSVISEPIKVIVPKPIEVESVEISGSDADLLLGDTSLFTATVLPENAEDKRITWASSDESVVMVADGAVSAVGGGTATITAAAASGAVDSIEVTVDGSKRTMRLQMTRIRQDDNNIGDEWGSVFELNGERAGQSYAISVGDTLSFRAEITEYDDNPDVGTATASHTVTDEDFANGFAVTMDVYVRENGGRNRGQSAHFVVSYIFSI